METFFQCRKMWLFLYRLIFSQKNVNIFKNMHFRRKCFEQNLFSINFTIIIDFSCFQLLWIINWREIFSVIYGNYMILNKIVFYLKLYKSVLFTAVILYPLVSCIFWTFFQICPMSYIKDIFSDMPNVLYKGRILRCAKCSFFRSYSVSIAKQISFANAI